jgi:1-acyl-sn-glycerol-3-phosphate acyltransferase
VIRGAVIILLLFGNLVLWATPVFFGGLVKLLTFGPPKGRVIRVLTWLAERWAAGNNRIFDTLLDTKWDVELPDGLRRDGHYLVISNHVNWVDIFALFRAFQGRVPFIRFFLKQILIWFPFAGQACWALEFPFMRRYTPEYLAQHPEKRGRDLETTRRACRRYRYIPVTILNFCEGTRFTRDKHEEQDSPYRYLLRPRVGGVGFVLASLGEQLDAVLDITLIYPSQDVTMWDFITNRVPRVGVRGRRLEVPDEFYTAGITEPGPARDRFKTWIEGVWREKDALLGTMVPTYQSTNVPR